MPRKLIRDKWKGVKGECTIKEGNDQHQYTTTTKKRWNHQKR